MDDLFLPGKQLPNSKAIGTMENDKKSNYHAWSAEEEQQLRDSVTQYGKDWQKIHQHVMPKLLPVQIKNKYYTLVKRSSVSESGSEIEHSIKSNNNSSLHMEQKQSKQSNTKQAEPDAWLNFNFTDHPDFLNFDDYMK